MKKNIFMFCLIGLISLGASITSCSPDYETDFDKDILNVPYRSRATLLLTQEGGQREIKVETNIPVDRWNATSNSPWCEVTKQQDKVLVRASKNENYKTRLAEVTIFYGHQRYNIVVRQLGEESALDIIEEDGFKKDKRGIAFKEIDAVTETVTVPLHTNLDVDNVIVPDTAKWITQVKDASSGEVGPSGDYKFGRKNIVLKIEKNTNLNERLCTVILQSSQNWNATAELVIKQGPRGFIVEPIEGKTEFEVEDVGEIIRVPFKRNGGKETIEHIIPSEVDWIKPAPSTRTMHADELSFIVEPNIVVQPREATFKIRSKNNNEVSEFNVTVKQKAFVEVVPNNVSNLTTAFGEKPGTMVLSWTAPEKINYAKVVISFTNLVNSAEEKVEVVDKTLSSVTIKKVFNTLGDYTFKVKTEGPTGVSSEEIEVKGKGSYWYKKGSKIALTASMVTANATEGSEGSVAALFDGVKKSNGLYHSRWSGGSDDRKKHYIQLNFTAEQSFKMFTFDYATRFTGNGEGDIRRAKIYVGTSDDNLTEIGELRYDIPVAGQAGRGVDVLAKGFVSSASGFTKIRFTPQERRSRVFSEQGTSNDWFNLSELELYEIYGENWGKENHTQLDD